MKHEWKPGDVARIKADGIDAPAIRTAEGEWAWVDRHGSNPVSGGLCLAASDYDQKARPLVVIDPEDREQVERLIRLVDIAAKRTDLLDADIEAPRRHNFMAALREFANPKPPKPEEPTGLGAVVENDQGRRFIRQHDGWWRGDEPCTLNWTAVHAVRVLSEGVTP